jgi:hypothetical protein
MKKALNAALFICITFMNAKAQNVGIGTATPLEKLSVGSTSQFRVDANGNITRINNVAYSFPTIAGTANQVLVNDGTGNLTWGSASSPSVAKPVVRIFSAVPSGFSFWAIDNAGDYNNTPNGNLNPTLVLYRGFTYQFSINAPGHPFIIAISDGGPMYNVGVTNNNQSVGTITFTVPMDAPTTLHYNCTVHAAMNGIIEIH